MIDIARVFATCGITLILGLHTLPLARADTPVPCSSVTSAELKRWQPKDLIATYCADKGEAERLLPKSTPGSAVRAVVEANQARLDACEHQMDMLEQALIQQLGRPMPSCTAWRH